MFNAAVNFKQDTAYASARDMFELVQQLADKLSLSLILLKEHLMQEIKVQLLNILEAELAMHQ